VYSNNQFSLSTRYHTATAFATTDSTGHSATDSREPVSHHQASNYRHIVRLKPALHQAAVPGGDGPSTAVPQKPYQSKEQQQVALASTAGSGLQLGSTMQHVAAPQHQQPVQQQQQGSRRGANIWDSSK
jgi:hypothetical protein